MRKVFLFAICVFFWQVSASQPVLESSPQKLKILSWNIYMLPAFMANRNGRRADAIGDLLAISSYDVIVFEEAFCPLARRHIRKSLAAFFPYQAGPANQKTFSLKTNSGIWIFSKYPIVRNESIVFKTRQGSDALSRKGALLIELDVHGKTIQLVGTHLQNSGDEWLRHAQCVEVYERLLKPNKKVGTPQVICGDFNINKLASPESYQFMLTTLGAADGELTGDRKFTYDRVNNDLHVENGIGQDLIDYILVRNNGAWVDCATRQIKALQKQWHSKHADLSDHYSMEAEIFFTNIPAVVSVR